MSLIRLDSICRSYDMGSETVHALRGVSIAVERGEYVAIMGPSGSGKSTLMNVLGCLDTPSSGTYELNGHSVGEMDDDELADIRNREIGFVFQTFNLLARSTALRNVELPLIYAGMDLEERREVALAALTAVGLGDRVLHRPNEMSGGQRQRVAIACAMVLEPDVLVADEPVSMLDVSLRSGILRVMLGLREKRGVGILFITHDLSLAWLIADRIAVMYLGRIVEIGPAEELVADPRHPYTRALLSVMPSPDPSHRRTRQILKGETPDASRVPAGCRFHTRCPLVFDRCRIEDPAQVVIREGHMAACFLADDSTAAGRQQTMAQKSEADLAATIHAEAATIASDADAQPKA